MACNGCTKQFGFWTSELGCPNCKFSFCKACLKYPAQLNKAKKNVCLKCSDTIKRQASGEVPAGPKKGVLQIFQEADPVEIPVLEPKPIKSTPDSTSSAADPDLDLRARLNALKDDPNLEAAASGGPNDKDMAQRLAALKGVEFKEYDQKAFIHALDNRTDQEKTDDLVKQFVEESAIDAKKVDPIADIERRLALLRGDDPIEGGSKKDALDSQLDNSDSENEETAVKKLAKKYLEEVKIEGPLDPMEKEFIESLPPPSADTEELPWCTICNEDAAIRCVTCDGELFCRRCFKECHDDDEEWREHETKPYTKKKEKQESAE